MLDVYSLPSGKPAPEDDPAPLPADHPAVPRQKIGVLIANLGTPDGTDYWSMRRYLNEFLSDRRVIDYNPLVWQPLLQTVILTKRPFTSGANYKTIWNDERNESPLMTITRSQSERLGALLEQRYGGEVVVDFCMRYGNPSTRSKVRAMVEAGCTRILFFPLYPQYAGATTATANDAFFAALARETWQPASRTVPPYFEHPDYIEVLAQSVERVWQRASSPPDLLVASYHGVPKRYLLQGDPYHCQCQKTTRLLRERLGWECGPHRHHLPVPIRTRGMAAALHGQGGRTARRDRHPPHRGDRAGFFLGLHRDAGGDQRRDPRGVRACRRRELHLHPLPERRAQAYRGAGQDHRRQPVGLGAGALTARPGRPPYKIAGQRKRDGGSLHRPLP